MSNQFGIPIAADVHDSRVLPPNHPNYYFVTKSDVQTSKNYKLNIVKPYPRSKFKAFFTSNGGTYNSGKDNGDEDD